MARQEIGTRHVGIGQRGGLAGIVEIVVKTPPVPTDSVLDADAWRKLLVGTRQTGVAERIQDHRLLELVGENGALIGEDSGAKAIRGDGGPAAEKGWS